MRRYFPSRRTRELEKKLSAEGIPDPVPRKLMDGIHAPSGGDRKRSEQNPRFWDAEGEWPEKNLFLL
jgi:hypothetical protein